MAISYPLTLPSTVAPRSLVIRPRSAIGVSESPFSLVQQVYEHQGQAWAADLDYPPMDRAEAEELVGFLLALNGRRGTFLMGEWVNRTPRGTWSAPVVNGTHAAGVMTLNLRNVDGKTWKRGDWLQLGSGSTAHLHKVTQDGSQSGSPQIGEVEIWPRTRAALADGDTVTLSSPVGQWRLASNAFEWSIVEAQEYGVRISAVEAL